MPTMPDQFSLPGFDDPPPSPRQAKPPLKPDFNLFLALVPDDEDAPRIHTNADALCRPHGLSRRLIAPDRLHISLFGLAAYQTPLPRQEMEALCAKVDTALASLRHPSLPLVFNRVMSFGRPGATKSPPLVLRTDEASEKALQDLQHVVHLALTGKAPGRFTPHMTLLYDPLHFAEQAIEPIVWTARKLVLILSHVRKSQYDRLASWGLGASA